MSTIEDEVEMLAWYSLPWAKCSEKRMRIRPGIKSSSWIQQELLLNKLDSKWESVIYNLQTIGFIFSL